MKNEDSKNKNLEKANVKNKESRENEKAKEKRKDNMKEEQENDEDEKNVNEYAKEFDNSNVVFILIAHCIKDVLFVAT